ncbi:MAG: VOC family protein [Treponema sp.]|jgi:PhnB protein|nr:VOC family protein [Treponema sp.]
MSNEMSLDVFLFFDGNCREAVEFYAQVFQQEIPKMMRYGENPDGSSEQDKDRILYASLPVAGQNMMFSDCPMGQNHIKGNNFAATLGSNDETDIKRIFQELSEGGQIYMPLGKTFFNELFGMVCDKFGVIWQLSLIGK